MEGNSGASISTGNLPPLAETQQLILEAYGRYRGIEDGQLSRVYPALETVDPTLFGICLVNTRGGIIAHGDSDVQLPIMSVAKPFVFAGTRANGSVRQPTIQIGDVSG